MWKTAGENQGRPGYLGKHKADKYVQWDNQFGSGKWRLVWKWGNRFLNFVQACGVYEEAYYQYLKNNPNVLRELLSVASEVYDDAVSNVSSRFDYTKQETNRTHIQDISIRHVVHRLGKKFEGDRLIQIRHDRGEHPLSMTLSPGVVPFHKPGRIIKPWLTGWWDAGTVECFYQSNRVLQFKT